MITIASATIVVREYDEAIQFFVDSIGFQLIEDTDMGNGKRWIVVGPGGGAPGARFVLAKGANESQLAACGMQAGGRVGFFLETNSFWDDYNRMKSKGVVFCEEPRQEPYGDVVVFQDLYGNKYDLIQRKQVQAAAA